MRNVFNDPELENDFRKNGYVSLPFISATEVEELKRLFFETLPHSGGQITPDETGIADSHAITYDFTFIDKKPEYKRRVFEAITRYFRPHMEKLLAGYKPIIANYIRKQSATGEVPLHQNWAFADEKRCSTVSIWCPLVDSTVENGTLQVVPGSHKRFGEMRGPMVPWELDQIKKDIINRYLVPLETKAGDCVVLDDSIVHYSAINTTNDLRLAIQLICIPGEFPSIHYHMDPSLSMEKIDVLETDVEFYMQFNPWKKPEGLRKVRSINFRHRSIDSAEFEKRLARPGFDAPVPAPGFFDRLKRVFSF